MRETQARLRPSSRVTETAGEEQAERHTALEEARRLGPVYGTLNQLAPIARLLAFVALCRGDRAALSVVLPMAASVAASLARAPLLKIAGSICLPVEVGEGSSTFHQTRLTVGTLLRCMVHVVLMALCLLATDPAACGLGALGPDTPFQLACGLAMAAGMCALWTIVPSALGVESRADGGKGLRMEAREPHDLSTATEDELLREMRPALLYLHQAARYVSLALETVADALLFFVFLVSRVEGDAPHAGRLYGGSSPPWLGLCLASLCYGSQHLRWRGEWILCAAFGAAQGAACFASGGSLVTTLCAGVTFALYRYAKRTQDVRKLRAQ